MYSLRGHAVIAAFATPLAVTTMLSGCVRPPALDEPFQSEPRLQVRNIVTEAKCELQNAVVRAVYEHPETHWLAEWETKTHLTLVVDALAGLSPGATLTEPLHNAYNITAGASTLPLTNAAALSPSIAAVPQNFTLGIGGGLSTEAIRTEDVEFDLAINQIPAFQNWKVSTEGTPQAVAKRIRDHLAPYVDQLQLCGQQGGILLEGDLGLGEWVAAALGPAAPNEGEAQLLTPGNNPPPAGGAGAAQSAAEAELSRKLAQLRSQAATAQTAAAPLHQKTVPIAQTVRQGGHNVSELVQHLPLSPADATAKEIKDLEDEIAKTKKAIDDTRKHAKEIYDAAKLFYGGVITPIAAAVGDTAKCAQIMQPELAGASLSFAQAGFQFSRIEDYGLNDDSAARLAEYMAGGNDAEKLASLRHSAAALKKQADDFGDALKKEQTAEQELEKAVSRMLSDFEQCRKAAPPAPTYDPLSTVSHEIDFIVTYSGGVNPTWKFARVSVPNSPLFAASRKYTNRLIIAMGRKGQDVAQQVQTQQLRAAFQNP